MAAYKLFLPSGVIRTADGAQIPPDPANADYQAFLAWNAMPGNTADPADQAPLVYTRGQSIAERRVRTANATPAEIFRAPVPQNTVYKAVLTIWGVTDDFLNFRGVEASVFVGRAAGGVALIQTRVSPSNATIEADHAIGTGGVWPLPSIAVDNTAPAGVQRRDVVISVTGPATPAVNWLLTGSYETFTPGGA